MDIDLEMARDLTAPGQARKAIQALREHIDSDVLGDTVLLVSELVSNSVKYGDGDILMRVRTRGMRQVLVEVVDDGGGFSPQVRRPSRFQASGYGLHLVDGVASSWGVHAGTAHVWFEIDRSADLAAVA
jgi:two-component sensor histidine kinase